MTDSNCLIKNIPPLHTSKREQVIKLSLPSVDDRQPSLSIQCDTYPPARSRVAALAALCVSACFGCTSYLMQGRKADAPTRMNMTKLHASRCLITVAFPSRFIGSAFLIGGLRPALFHGSIPGRGEEVIAESIQEDADLRCDRNCASALYKQADEPEKSI